MQAGYPRHSLAATVAPYSRCKQGQSSSLPSCRIQRGCESLVEAAGGVCQHRVDLAGIGGQIIAGYGRPTIAARYVVKQPLELMNVVFDGLPEVRIGTIFAANFFKRPLPLGSIEPLCKRAALAAFVALPEVGRGIIVDHPSDIDRKRVKRVDAITCRGLLGVGSLAGRDRRPLRVGFARSACQEIG